MKRAAAIMLILCFSYQIVAKLGIVAWYNINKDYVARELCENRNQPKMNCCGKCYLNKQIKKTEDIPDSKGKQTTAKWEKTELFITTFYTKSTFPLFEYANLLIHFDGYHFTYSHTAIASIFHPPPVA